MNKLFHPAVAQWFIGHFVQPPPAQAQAWPAIKAGRHTLIAAPTGSGKTLAAFLAAIDDLVRQGVAGPLADATQVVYVSPLKALSNDIQRNLEAPLAGIRAELSVLGLPELDIRTFVRTGDTPQRERSAMRRRPPHVVVTTPESLYILMGSQSGRQMLASTRTVIVDEIHAMVGSKRGVHLALTLERLESLLKEKSVMIFARIDFSGDAGRAGLTMRPEQMLIFGNPKAGTPLMQSAPSVGLDLPMKALVWQDASGQTQIAYNDPQYIIRRHGLDAAFAANLAAVVPLIERAAAE